MTIKHYWLLAMLILAVPASGQLYRWVDEQGQVHYSDTPREGAEELTLKPTNVIQSQRPKRIRPTARALQDQQASDQENEEESSEQAFTGYTSIKVTSPTQDQSLWNIGGELTVSVSTDPGLQPGHGVIVYLDGKAINDPVASTSLTIGDVYRGTHSVRAAITSEQGAVLINGPAVTFHVRQTSVNN